MVTFSNVCSYTWVKKWNTRIRKSITNPYNIWTEVENMSDWLAIFVDNRNTNTNSAEDQGTARSKVLYLHWLKLRFMWIKCWKSCFAIPPFSLSKLRICWCLVTAGFQINLPPMVEDKCQFPNMIIRCWWVLSS